MKPRFRSLVAPVVVYLALSGTFVFGANRPVTGKALPGFEPIDAAVLEFMDTIGCQAATIAISREGRLLFSRGYGWSDEARKKPVAPDALMRVASITKPITAALVRNAIRDGKLSLETKAFELIAVKPPGGKIADRRINTITVGQLLEHKGGWDAEATFDPMFNTRRVERELKLNRPATPVNVIEYMLTQPLQFTPGENTAYSNFGYCVLGRVLEKVLKKPYATCVEQGICKPLGIEDIKLAHSALRRRYPREVWYPVAPDAFSVDVMDSHGGAVASAPALCTFLQAYWTSGEPRYPRERGDWVFFGSLPGTTAMARQRRDGLNIAVILNGRREKHFKEDNDLLRQMIDRAIKNSVP